LFTLGSLKIFLGSSRGNSWVLVNRLNLSTSTIFEHFTEVNVDETASFTIPNHFIYEKNVLKNLKLYSNEKLSRDVSWLLNKRCSTTVQPKHSVSPFDHFNLVAVPVAVIAGSRPAYLLRCLYHLVQLPLDVLLFSLRFKLSFT
jgi:hypothetical protein